MLWIYDNNSIKELLLEEWFHIKLDGTQIQDIRNKKRPAMRDVCKVALDYMNQASNNCPIILALLTFNIFSHYLTTRRKQNQSHLEKYTYGGI